MILEAFQLGGKNVLVTGSQKGRGTAIAVALAQTCEEIRALGRKTFYFAGVVRECLGLRGLDREHRRRIWLDRDAHKQRGDDPPRAGISGGVLGRSVRCQSHSRLTTFTTCRSADAQARKTWKDHKHRVHAVVPRGDPGAYAAGKRGVSQLRKAFSNEWAAKGINVHAIAPGYRATDNPTALDRFPAGRWGKPREMARAAVFLSSAASDYVHGHVLIVAGSWLGR